MRCMYCGGVVPLWLVNINFEGCSSRILFELRRYHNSGCVVLGGNKFVGIRMRKRPCLLRRRYRRVGVAGKGGKRCNSVGVGGRSGYVRYLKKSIRDKEVCNVVLDWVRFKGLYEKL